MPTPSEAQGGEWTARTNTPPRSVFGNYRAAGTAGSADAGALCRPPTGSGDPVPASEAVELGVARAFIYRFIAKAFEDPSAEGWNWLCSGPTRKHLAAAWEAVAPGQPLQLELQPCGFTSFHDSYLAAFGHAARGSCPLNEIEYGDLKADPLFQPHRLADLAAFYRAFGLEIAEEAGERQDHLCIEMEFMCVLATKEGYARASGLADDPLRVCLEAQKSFLREHLGRWVPAFTRRLMGATSETALRQLATLTFQFVEVECSRFNVKPGSLDLSLRPVDETADRMCGSCGIRSLPAGALGT